MTSATEALDSTQAGHAPATEKPASTTKIVEEIVEPIPATHDAPSPVETETVYDELEALEAWSFANYVFVVGCAAVFGALLWFLGGNRLAKRLLAGRGRGRGEYKKVGEDDVEKQS